MEFKSRILSNGLAVIGEVNQSARSAAVGFFVKTGSRDETAQINGVSHFLEHMLFKGTGFRPLRSVSLLTGPAPSSTPLHRRKIPATMPVYCLNMSTR